MSVDPVPANPPVSTSDGSAVNTYAFRYLLNAMLVLMSVLSVAGSIVTQAGITGAWLGLSDVQWHWALVGFALATALNTAFSHTPPVTNPPTLARLDVESKVEQLRKLV